MHTMSDVQPSTITVYCGSSPGHQPAYADAARRLGAAMAERGLSLVYGGGKVGLMGVIADAVLDAGGRAIGVMPRHLFEREIAHVSLTELHVVESMHERKQRMAELGDAFVLMPGGFGSWEEFCEAVTWSQLGLHRKACGILNVLDYYAPFLSMTEHAVAQGFVRESHRTMIVIDSDPEVLLGRLFEPRAPVESKWVGVRA